MRTTKCIFALGCLTLALFPARFAIMAFSRFDYALQDDYKLENRLMVYCTAGFFAILALSLVFTGAYLLTRLNSPLSRKAKLLFFLHPLAVGILVALVAPDICKDRFAYVYDADPSVNNLCLIEAAANQFAVAHLLTNGQAIKFPDDLTPYLKGGKIPPCPRGSVYRISKVGESPTVTPSHILP